MKITDHASAPDVPWGADGIDALVWTDTEPYADVLPQPTPTRIENTPDEQLLWYGRS